tara:strand:+ start:124 stop:438 length:315 start_codon:yes stop_codon:yes gene_type:complete
MNSSLPVGIIFAFLGVIVFILISKSDLGVTSLKKDKESEQTLLGRMAASFPGTDLTNSENKEEEIVKVSSEPIAEILENNETNMPSKASNKELSIDNDQSQLDA